MNKKNKPNDTDNFQLNYTITGSLTAKNPQTKNSIYDSAADEDIKFKIFYISSYASFYPLLYSSSLKISFQNINKIKPPKFNNNIIDVVVKFCKTLSLK